MWRNWIQRHLTASAEMLLHCHCFCEYEGNYAPLMYKYIDSENCVQPGTLDNNVRVEVVRGPARGE